MGFYFVVLNNRTTFLYAIELRIFTNHLFMFYQSLISHLLLAVITNGLRFFHFSLHRKIEALDFKVLPAVGASIVPRESANLAKCSITL